MSSDRLYVEGELYLSLETIAEIYEVQVVWLREVYESGLLGSGVNSGSTVCIGAVRMDRVATVVRMYDVLGLDIESIALALEDA